MALSCSDYPVVYVSKMLLKGCIVFVTLLHILCIAMDWISMPCFLAGLWIQVLYALCIRQFPCFQINAPLSVAIFASLFFQKWLWFKSVLEYPSNPSPLTLAIHFVAVWLIPFLIVVLCRPSTMDISVMSIPTTVHDDSSWSSFCNRSSSPSRVSWSHSPEKSPSPLSRLPRKPAGGSEQYAAFCTTPAESMV